MTKSDLNALVQELPDLVKNGFVILPLATWESVNRSTMKLVEMVERKDKEIEALDLRIKTLVERG